MDSKNLITPEKAKIYLDDYNFTEFENSVDGRARMFHDLYMMGMDDEREAILQVWGDAPTVFPLLSELKAQKKNEIAASRYAVETGGITVSGATVDTDRDSQALITGAALAAVIDGEYSLNWKTASGFIHLAAPEIIAVAQAVRAHVQSCFDREGELVALVDAAQTAKELDAIEITFE